MKLPTCRTRIVYVTIIGLLSATAAGARGIDGEGQCRQAGGMILTNLGAVDASTSLGSVTGDLRGSVAATVLSVAPGKGGTTVFTVQHHWTTESGDTLNIPVAKATTIMVSPGLFAVLSYPFTIVGGTGKFDRATGRFETMGEVDLNAGHTVFRYKGELCFGGSED